MSEGVPDGWEVCKTGRINLESTLQSGQVFHWERHPDGTWTGLVDFAVLDVCQAGDFTATPIGQSTLASDYFSLDHPLDEMVNTFPEAPLVQQAVLACDGLRIIRQPRWECLATFITSPMKQVSHIREISKTLRRRFGDPVGPHFAYPRPSTLAQLKASDLRDCSLGFRAEKLLATAQLIAQSPSVLDDLAGLPTSDLRKQLIGFPGIGEKVANCILLFAYERLDAVPIDVWILRILTALRRGRKATPRQLAGYARRKFGPYAGYLQQYLFHYARTKKSIS